MSHAHFIDVVLHQRTLQLWLRQVLTLLFCHMQGSSGINNRTWAYK